MKESAISRFPAIVIGGPPHTGKSILANSLKKKLKADDLMFYQFSATPDGEGDWFQEADPTVGQTLREGHKRPFTPDFVKHVCRDIAARPLPFLLDMGGRPQDW